MSARDRWTGCSSIAYAMFGMQLHWHDVGDTLVANQWRGLLVTVRDAHRGGFTVSVCPPRCIRIAVQGAALAWARIFSDFYGYELLRSCRGASLGVIPPIPFSSVAEHAELAPSASSRAWARYFARMLSTSPASPLHDGCWRIGTAGLGPFSNELAPALVERIVTQRHHGDLAWDLGDSIYPIGLRAFSPPEHGRVKAWRKHARAGSLPPVLLFWVSGLAAYVVLDGHDRLVAGAQEGSSVPVLTLEPVQDQGADEITKDGVLQQLEQALASADQRRSRSRGESLARAERLTTVEDANRVLLNAFVPKLKARLTQAEVLAGGLGQWVQEVEAELALQGIAESRMLDGLQGRATGA